MLHPETLPGIAVVAVLLALTAGCAPQEAPPRPEGAGDVTLRWNAPTSTASGSCAVDLAGFRVRWGTSPDRLDQSRDVSVDEAGCELTGRKTPCGEVRECRYTVENLPEGKWYFSVQAYDGRMRLSAPSGMAERTVLDPR